MKTTFRYLTFCCLLLTPFASLASVPELESPIAIQSQGIGIAVGGGHATVDVVDWNNDRKKDLLVGTYADGNILLFLNKGKDSAPRFTRGGSSTRLSRSTVSPW